MKVPHLLELEIQIWNMSKVLKTLKISIDDMEEWQTRARRFLAMLLLVALHFTPVGK